MAVGQILQGQRGQVQPGGPAFCTGLQAGNIVCFQFNVMKLAEKLAGLVGRKTQVMGADFTELVAHAQPRQGKGDPHG